MGYIRPEATAPTALQPAMAAWPNRPHGLAWLAQPMANRGLASPRPRQLRRRGNHRRAGGQGGARPEA
jgi:hypothetical protein